MAANNSNHADHDHTNPTPILDRAAAFGGQKMFSALSDEKRHDVTHVQLEFLANRFIMQPNQLGPNDWSVDVPRSSAGPQRTLVARSVALGTIDQNPVQSAVVAAHIQVVCDFANRWHQVNHSVNPHGDFLGDSPLFAVYDGFMATIDNIPTQPLPPSFQFSTMRYLFLPVAVEEGDGTDIFGDTHMGLLAISPETKTMEWLDSEATDARFFDRFISQVFRWMAATLNDGIVGTARRFIPSEWIIRSTRGRQSAPDRLSSEMYVMAHAQWMAFGYDRNPDQPMAWPDTFVASMQPGGDRRFRVANDLLADGQGRYFTHSEHADLANIDNAQYYPILDTPVVVDRTQWTGFNAMPVFATALPPLLRNRRVCYRNCPSKNKMKRHCQRNRRFYPGYTTLNVSGPGIALAQFTAWVEDMDYRESTGELQVKPFGRFEGPSSWPMAWIDPREDTVANDSRGPFQRQWN